MTLTAGVIAVQGDVSEHATAIETAAARHDTAVEVVTIRDAGLVPDCDLLLIPGGESTTISTLLASEGIDDEIRTHVGRDKPVLATCAGLIVLARDAQDGRVDTLGLLDVTVDRNAFGRQADSFQTPLNVAGLDTPFPAVFIRAPAIETVGERAAVLAEWNDRIVAARDGPIVATAFHPELTEDARIHELAFFHEG
ncbi:pyridoxal 5'-phosphate synthase glutaminase subunit PdxT [Halobacteriales archaeon SW_6_65_46]|nr:MAG: pyridoxal 5'-phosphate synthase glutaminase subunit PdxT [Halobacteriales archaeon SW_6_65_46]